MDKLVIKLSSTALGKSTCILNFYRTVVQGYKELSMPSRVIYGIAVAKFLDTMYKINNPVVSAVEAKKCFSMTKDDDRRALHLSDERHMLTVCLNVWATFAQEDNLFAPVLIDGIPATEVSFEIPYFENDYIKVFLCGTMDKVGKMHNGPYCVGDWKTTSAYNEEKYQGQWELSRQLRFYTLACKLMAEREPDSILGRIGKTHMGAFIDAIFLDKDPNNINVKRGDLFQYSDIELEAFRASLDLFIVRLSDVVKNDMWRVKEGILNGACMGQYKCAYWHVCKNNEQVGELLLKKYFKIQEFNPLNYNGL